MHLTHSIQHTNLSEELISSLALDNEYANDVFHENNRESYQFSGRNSKKKGVNLKEIDEKCRVPR